MKECFCVMNMSAFTSEIMKILNGKNVGIGML